MKKMIIFALSQAIVFSILFCTIWTVLGLKSGFSALMGALAWGVPSFLFFVLLLSTKKSNDPQKIVKYFNIGEITKLFLVIVFLIIIIKIFSVNIIPLICGFIISVIASWVALSCVLFE